MGNCLTCFKEPSSTALDSSAQPCHKEEMPEARLYPAPSHVPASSAPPIETILSNGNHLLHLDAATSGAVHHHHQQQHFLHHQQQPHHGIGIGIGTATGGSSSQSATAVAASATTNVAAAAASINAASFTTAAAQTQTGAAVTNANSTNNPNATSNPSAISRCFYPARGVAATWTGRVVGVHSKSAPTSVAGAGATMGAGDSRSMAGSIINTTWTSTSETKLAALFEQYKDPMEDAILAEGIVQLCKDLQISPDDFKILVLAWKLQAEQMCRFTRTEFVTGLRAIRADSIRTIQQRLPELVTDVGRNAERFKDLYKFTFRFGLDASQRNLPTPMAVVLWRLVFTVREPAILNRWLNFLDTHPAIRGITKDTWNMFLNFTDAVGNDLSCYDDTEAWPSLFDDFVEYENDQANQNISKDNTGKSDNDQDGMVSIERGNGGDGD